MPKTYILGKESEVAYIIQMPRKFDDATFGVARKTWSEQMDDQGASQRQLVPNLRY